MLRIISRNARLFFVVAGFMFCMNVVAAEATESTTIHFGVSPFFSTNVQFQQTMIQPIVNVLQGSYGLTVDYQSAADNVQFVRAAQDGRYDVVFVPANVAALLAADSGFRPMVGYHLPQNFAIYVLKDSAPSSVGLESLKGKRVGMPDEFGLTATQALGLFQKQGLLPGRLIVRYEKYDQLVLQLFQHNVDAVVMNPQVLTFLEPNLRNRLALVYNAPEIDLKLTHVYLISPRVRKDLAKQVTDAFIRYHENPTVREGISRDGRYLMSGLTQRDLEPALRYADDLRLRLKSGVALERVPQGN